MDRGHGNAERGEPAERRLTVEGSTPSGAAMQDPSLSLPLGSWPVEAPTRAPHARPHAFGLGRRSRREAALVCAAQAGDRGAFDRLWEGCAPLIHAILVSMVPHQDAPDLLQDVALATLRSLDRLRQPERFSAWVCTIARNAGRDALRARREARVHEVCRDVTDVEAPGGAAGADEIVADEILARVRCLPAAYREPLILRLVLGLSGPEIAARTGRTPGSVRVNLCKGMKMLRKELVDGGLL